MLDTNTKVDEIEPTKASDADVVFEIGDVRETRGALGHTGDGGNGLMPP